MKIPETAPNVGAYYGNEENGQWQPNGVIIDSGVGGGVVGSGDAGIHRPPVYPVHIPRAHMPGYVMAGAYYPPAAYPPVPTQPQPDDFADYMWMENEEEFDKQVMQQLEEEALMEQCIEAMLEDEQREQRNRGSRPTHNGHNHQPTTSNGGPSLSLEETVSRSTLNPLAAEFVPTRSIPAPTEERAPPPAAPVSAPACERAPPEASATPEHTQDKPEEPVAPQTDPPEVSAAEIIDKQEKRPRDKRDTKTKVEVKKTVAKQEIKSKVKPQTVKSETKVTPKKKEVSVKSVKSETKLEEKIEDVIVVPEQKPLPTPLEETQPTSGFKPINYAAAAKANKPKKPPTTPNPAPPTTDKPQTIPKVDKKPTDKKDKLKTEKINVQRKNSAK
ncbi:hypothetical protein PYW07_012554 [Mythimna separata]|uniref:Ataxin-2 C-terminal domain-containing protein n=1 Tax=Mythimna separata TaxID=271217 RepID=A0AAD8DLC6_MYTSE|nr:hypothetical protein PYW07_012554 [Mythimna separata]